MQYTPLKRSEMPCMAFELFQREITPYLAFRLSTALLWLAEKKIFSLSVFFFAIGVRTQAKAQRR